MSPRSAPNANPPWRPKPDPISARPPLKPSSRRPPGPGRPQLRLAHPARPALGPLAGRPPVPHRRLPLVPSDPGPLDASSRTDPHRARYPAGTPRHPRSARRGAALVGPLAQPQPRLTWSQRPNALNPGNSSGRRPAAQSNFRSPSEIARSLMLATRRCISPRASNSHNSFPYDLNHVPAASCHS